MTRPTQTLATLALLAAAAIVLPTAPLAAATDWTVEGHGGVPIAATYWPAEGDADAKPAPAVMLFHMCNSDRSAWMDLGAELARRGIHALAFDYRGYGESGDAPETEGQQNTVRVRDEIWAADIDAVFAKLVGTPGVDASRIGAAGGSCGVNQSVQLARRHPENVTTLVLLAGSVRNGGDRYLADNPWIPVLAAAAGDDGQDAPLTRWTAGFSGHPGTTFVSYDTGGHGTDMFAVHDDLEPRIADWFQKYLIEEPVSRPESFEPNPGPSMRLWDEFLAEGGARAITERLQEARRTREPDFPIPPEVAVNAEGYRLMGEEKWEAAIEMLRFNVVAYPLSANALDSLADAYWGAGNREKAARLARLAIAQLEDDPNLNDDFKKAVRESAEKKLEFYSEPKAD